MKSPSKFSVYHLITIINISTLVPDMVNDWDNIYYVAWLDMFLGALRGLQYYNVEQQVWGQAHVLAGYVIF